MSLPPIQNNDQAELLSSASSAQRHLFFEHQALKYKLEKETLANELSALKQNAVKNQQHYDALYHLFYHLLHQREGKYEAEKTRLGNNKINTRTNAAIIPSFIEAFNELFSINKTRIIYLNQPRLRKTHSRSYVGVCSHSHFWDISMSNLFAKQHISFAPIDTSISMKLFAHPSLQSAGMIPFKVRDKQNEVGHLSTRVHHKKTISHSPSRNALFVFGSEDQHRFLPDSTQHLDLLTCLQNMLGSL